MDHTPIAYPNICSWIPQKRQPHVYTTGVARSSAALPRWGFCRLPLLTAKAPAWRARLGGSGARARARAQAEGQARSEVLGFLPPQELKQRLYATAFVCLNPSTFQWRCHLQIPTTLRRGTCGPKRRRAVCL